MAGSRAGARSFGLPAFWTVEDLEAVFDVSGDEQHVARTEWAALRPVDELPAPAHDHVELVAGVRCLRVCATGSVDLDLHAPVPEHLREPFSAGPGQMLHGLIDRNPASSGPSASLTHLVSFRIASSRRPSSSLTSGHSSSMML